MPLTHENIMLLWKLFVSSYNEGSHGESKISAFPYLCPGYLNKNQIHPANPANPDILKFITKLL